MGARHTALTALIACRKAGAWSDSVLDAHIRRDKLDARDAALATRLCCGVLQNRLLLDYYLQAFSSRRLADLQPVVLDILRLGAYQLVFLDRIPASAAVSEAVEQAKRSANQKAAGYVNGVLRALGRGPLPEVPGEDPLERLSILYSQPRPMLDLLAQNVPEAALEPMLKANNTVPATAMQVNPGRGSPTELAFQVPGGELHPWLPDCVVSQRLGDPEKLEAFAQGRFWVQDPAAKLAVLAMDLKPDMQVLDACAAPGGKTFAAAAILGGTGRVLACDIHENKLGRIEAGARRLGFESVQVRCMDASKPDEALTEAFDAVILDVPCSGLGVIRKKSDIRYKDLAALEALPEKQLNILENRCNAVKKGGILLYATCTILKRENEDVIAAFLAGHPEFWPEAFTVPGLGQVPAGMATLYPGGPLDTDGFFFCKLRRTT